MEEKNIEENKIDEISTNVEKFLEKRSTAEKKINNIEDRIDKMQNYLARPEIEIQNHSEERDAFNNFIRKGIESNLITKDLSSGENTGGVLIAPTLSKKIISAVEAKSPMRKLASVESISTKSLEIVSEDGSFASGWVGETGERNVTESSKLSKKTIETHEIYAQPKATQSILDDAEIDIDSWIIERIADQFIRLENEAFISGDGNNKPFGLLKNETIERLDVGAEVTPHILLDMISKLDEGYLSNASFVMNRKTLSKIQSLTDESGRFIWQQSLSDPLEQTIFGVPIVISSHMPNIGASELAIAIGDFESGYKIVDRSGINLMRDPYTDKPFIRGCPRS